MTQLPLIHIPIARTRCSTTDAFSSRRYDRIYFTLRKNRSNRFRIISLGTKLTRHREKIKGKKIKHAVTRTGKEDRWKQERDSIFRTDIIKFILLRKNSSKRLRIISFGIKLTKERKKHVVTRDWNRKRRSMEAEEN